MVSSIQLDRLCVVLVGTRNPLNIGAAARAMSNFGVTHLRLVKPFEKAFREARSAVGAADIMAGAVEYESVAEAIADCSLVVGTTAGRRRELHHAAYRVEEGAELVRAHLASAGAAILFGSESYGLSTSDLSYCHWTMSITTPGTNASLNLGQAVAVCMHELVRETAVALPEKQVPPLRSLRSAPVGMTLPKETPRSGAEGVTELEVRAAAEEVDRVTEVLFEVLRETRYWHPGSGATTEEKVRRLVRRLHLSSEDAEVVLGMCRQILWRIRKGGAAESAKKSDIGG
jgi:TrmH family RNA methyltransferase